MFTKKAKVVAGSAVVVGFVGSLVLTQAVNNKRFQSLERQGEVSNQANAPTVVTASPSATAVPTVVVVPTKAVYYKYSAPAKGLSK